MSKFAQTTFDLTVANLKKGVPEHIDVDLHLPPIHLAGQDYEFRPDMVTARLTIILLDNGYDVSMSFKCTLFGACWRCLEVAELDLNIRVEDFFETELPPIEEMGEQEEASLWYSEDGVLNLSEWAKDAISEELPPKILCMPDCKGLCVQCGANLNVSECDCTPPPDSRWEKLKDWRPE